MGHGLEDTPNKKETIKRNMFRLNYARLRNKAIIFQKRIILLNSRNATVQNLIRTIIFPTRIHDLYEKNQKN